MAEIRQVDKNGEIVAQEAPQSIPNNVREMDGFDNIWDNRDSLSYS